jgi:hypothetical protein
VTTRSSSKRGVSEILAYILIIAIGIAAGAITSNVLSNTVSEYTGMPAHLRLVEAGIEEVSSNLVRITVTYNNPTDYTFTVRYLLIRYYTSGFTNQVTLQIVDQPAPLKIDPGETGNIEVIARSSASITRGVVAVYIQANRGDGASYTDVILIPVS